MAQGPDAAPVRIVCWGEHPQEITSLAYAAYQPYTYVYTNEERRTVSAGYSWGGGAVGLISSYDGQHVWFEWDNFGDWEDLPLPGGLEHMCLPELIVGFDGRWHIVYRHLFTGEVLCLSTL